MNFYLYRHIRLDKNEPFYIGIGKQKEGNCAYCRAYSKYQRNRYWKYIAAITSYEVQILFECNDEDLIKSKEIEFIALYGRKDLGKGTLCNLTDGGDGTLNPSLEHRKNLSEKAKKRKPNFLGKTHSEESKLKISKSRKGKLAWKVGTKFTMEHRRSISDSKKGKFTIHLQTIVNSRKRPVQQFDLNMNYIRDWECINDASVALKIADSSIGQNAKGRSRHAGGFIWKYKIQKNAA